LNDRRRREKTEKIDCDMAACQAAIGQTKEDKNNQPHTRAIQRPEDWRIKHVTHDDRINGQQHEKKKRHPGQNSEVTHNLSNYALKGPVRGL